MRVEAITGLSEEQVAELTKRVTRHLGAGDLARPGGRPCGLDLYRSIVLVVHLLRKNPTQQVAAAFFNVSQATVSRRWDLLRPILAVVLDDLVEPARTRIGRYGTTLVDGTICPTWDWKHVPHLYSAKAGYPGTNAQTACDPGGATAAIGPTPVPGARHDALTYGASGPKDMHAGLHTQADLGYVGADGIDLIPIKRRPGQAELDPHDVPFNIAPAAIRATVERAAAHMKTWRILSEEAGRFRPPLEKFTETLAAITGLLNLRRSFNPTFE